MQEKQEYSTEEVFPLPLQTLLSLSKLALLASDKSNGTELEGELA